MGISAASVSKARAAVKFVFDFLASSSIVCVPFSGPQRTIRAMIQSFESAATEGVLVDTAGRRIFYDLEVTISLDDLSSYSLTVNSISHFIIDGVRYDLETSEGVFDKMVPVGGIHNLVTLYLTKAVERTATSTVSSIGYVE